MSKRDEPGIIAVEWAQQGKESTDKGYRILSCSEGDIKHGMFAELLARYSPGTLKRDELPQVTISWFFEKSRRQFYVNLGYYYYPKDRPTDVAGRSAIRTKYFCVPFLDLAARGLSYIDLFECLSRYSLPDKSAPPLSVPFTRGAANILVGQELDFAKQVAAMLLTGSPVCILKADHLDMLRRLRFIDSVVSWLPYGIRSQLSASTWTSYVSKDHKLRLFFSSVDRGAKNEDQVVDWGTDQAFAGISKRYLTGLRSGSISREQLELHQDPMGFGGVEVHRMLKLLEDRQGREDRDRSNRQAEEKARQEEERARQRAEEEARQAAEQAAERARIQAAEQRAWEAEMRDAAELRRREDHGYEQSQAESAVPGDVDYPSGQTTVVRRPSRQGPSAGLNETVDESPLFHQDHGDERTGESVAAESSSSVLGTNELLESCRWALEDRDENMLQTGIERLEAFIAERSLKEREQIANKINELRLFEPFALVNQELLVEFYVVLLRLAFEPPIGYRRYKHLEATAGQFHPALIRAMREVTLQGPARLLLVQSLGAHQRLDYLIAPDESVAMMAEKLDDKRHQKIAFSRGIENLRVTQKNSKKDRLSFRKALWAHDLIGELQKWHSKEPQALFGDLSVIFEFAFDGTADEASVNELFENLRSAPSIPLLGAMLELAPSPKEQAEVVRRFLISSVAKTDLHTRTKNDLERRIKSAVASRSRPEKQVSKPKRTPEHSNRPSPDPLLGIQAGEISVRQIVVTSIVVLILVFALVALYLWGHL